MMKHSAGVIAYRYNKNKEIEVLLVHPGGPFFYGKDKRVWSIPKGEIEEGEKTLEAARREFEEEIGTEIPKKRHLLYLGTVKQNSVKIVTAYAVKMNIDSRKVKSNTFEVEWPPKSGNKQVYPEIDKADWFTIEEANEKIIKGQRAFLDILINLIGGRKDGY